MTFWSKLFKNKQTTKAGTDQLTFKQRLSALRNLPEFFKLVWQTSPSLTIANSVLRIRFVELTKGRTSVLISHRFSTVRMADRILVLDKGELLEMGSHKELLQQNGKYAELFQLQAKGYQ